MDSENLLIVCRICGRKTLMHNMRPDGTGENMICIDCYKKGIASRPTMSIKEAAAQEEASKVRKPATAEPMNKYICTSCKYKFSRKKSQEVSKCPYCGKTTIVLDNQLGADKLINDSLDKRFEKW